MNILDNISLTCRLITTSVLSLLNIILPLETHIEHSIKQINTMLNIKHGEFSNSDDVQESVRPEESGACDVVEESSGSCSEHEYDKVSASSGDQSESDEGEVSSK